MRPKSSLYTLFQHSCHCTNQNSLFDSAANAPLIIFMRRRPCLNASKEFTIHVVSAFLSLYKSKQSLRLCSQCSVDNLYETASLLECVQRVHYTRCFSIPVIVQIKTVSSTLQPMLR